MKSRIRAFCLALLLVALGRPALAIIVITDNTDHSQGAPPYLVSQIFTTDTAYTGGSYANSGSQFEGQFAAATAIGGGTAIAPNWFLTIQHLTPGPSSTFTYGGTSYALTGNSFDVGNGMTIYQVNGTFSSYATILPNDTNALKNAVTSAFGYGDLPDLTTTVNGPHGLQGYQWGGSTNKLSWGPGSVLGYVPDPSGNTYITGAFRPDLGVGNASSSLAGQDSGGGVFVKVNGTWQLAAVNYGVNGPYYPSSDPAAGGQFNAALWDQSGFFDSGGNAYSGPQQWYSSNITTAVFNTIQADIHSVPGPAALPLLAGGAALLAAGRRWRRRRAFR